MQPYELSNFQRKYFGLSLVEEKWDKVDFGESIFLYYNNDKIVKILDYSYGYHEYDTDIKTKGRCIILPRTNRGKEQKLSKCKILKIKGCGIDFSGSFLGGGIHVYDSKRKLFFIQSFNEDVEIRCYDDIDKWITSYIERTGDDYFNWLSKELQQKKQHIKAKQGDIIAFKISNTHFGFARILVDVFEELKKGNTCNGNLHLFHPRSLIVTVYIYYADTLEIDLSKLVNMPTLPAICIFDLEVYRGQMPVIGHKPLSEEDMLIPLPTNSVTSVTIQVTKSLLDRIINVNKK